MPIHAMPCVPRPSGDTILDDFRTVTKPTSPLHGHDRIIGLAVLTAVKDLYSHNPSIMLDELQVHLAIEHDTPISISALQATLQ